MTTIPAEWRPHKAIWTGWPSAADLWGEDLEPARAEVAAMVRALWDEGRGDKVRIMAYGREAEATAKLALGQAADVIPGDFGDIWFRDSGPIFTSDGKALGFQFNGWGGKYVLPHDDKVSARMALIAGAEFKMHDFILEGGAIEMDGEGTLITTRQCLLNPNRNAHWTEEGAEIALKRALGIEKVLWLDEGLMNDHTDGHIDNLARFVAPGVVVCQAPFSRDDPNHDVLEEIALALGGMRDAQGRKLEVVRIPSPGAVEDEDGDAVPASHMNFVIGNSTVVVPIYSGSGDDAVNALAPLFPSRKVIGLSSHAILTGGGSFHCITQQEPA
ncbi:MAG TPA: agmatine deiminase family protein [Vitreimonas sp.]|uniref:agmatine deiminase family protein n=1 Tax=Vitreimonas sp. TaxID=3069702 RepID=UPI002D275175|nr:agmatine deiminase family protein [Vitreimonas sp.]HYD89831.1 agmatine deiminase family protein [Vitreimonas sp.]